MDLSNQLKRVQTKGIHPQEGEKVLIKIPLQNGGFWQREYNQTDIIQNVIDDFKELNNEEIPEEYMSDWKHKNQSLKMTDEIKTLLVNEIPTLVIEHKEIRPLVLGEEVIPEIVGKPFYNPFEIFVFHKKEKILKIQKYDTTYIESLELDNYGPSSAYCNGKNNLFISGGEKKNSEFLKKFWKIDLKTQEIETNDMKEKKNHSMIFIKGNYIFIVGGNDLKTFYYDIENGTMNDWGDLNKKRTEPSLILISDYLYCFDNINSKNDVDEFTFEKTNLTSESGNWELIKPNLDSIENQKLNQKFFGVSKDIDDNILFLGGNMDEEEKENKYNYKYNINNNAIEVTDIPFGEYNFKEKTFLTYKNNVDYILPDFNRHHPEVIFFQKNKNKLSLVKYEPNNDNLLRQGKKKTLDRNYNFNMPSFSFPTSEENKNNIEKANPQFTNGEDSKNEIINENKNDISGNPFNNKDDNNHEIHFSHSESQKEKISLKNSGEKNDEDNDKSKSGININDKEDLISKDNINANGEINVNIQGINAQIIDSGINQKLDIDGGIKLENKIEIKEPEIKINEPYIDTNINTSGMNINNPKNDINIKVPSINIDNPQNDINVKIPSINLDNPQGEIKVPDVNFIDPNIHLPVNQTDGLIDLNQKITAKYPNLDNKPHEVKINGPKIELKTSENHEDYHLSGIIYGINDKRRNINDSKININGNLKGSKNIEGPNIDVKGQKLDINGPEARVDIKAPNGEINIPGINVNAKGGQISPGHFLLEGIIPGDKNYKKGKIAINSPDINIKGNSPDVKINAPDGKINLDQNVVLSGNIGGNKNIDIKAPDANLDLNTKNSENYITGIIPGIKSSDINIKGPNVNLPNINMESKNPELDINAPKINLKSGNAEINGNIKKSEFNINGPKIDINGAKIIKYSENCITGIIPGIKSSDLNIKGPNVNLPNINMENKAPGFDINPPIIKLKSGNAGINGNIPDYQINSPDINIKKPELDINGPKVDINEPKIDIEYPKFELPPGGIKASGNFEGQEIKGPNLNVNLPNIDLQGSKIDVKSPDININGPKLNAPNLNIEGINGSKNDFHLSGIIEGISKKSSNLPGINVEGPKLNVKGSVPDVNIKGPNIDQNIHGNINLKGDNDFSGVILGIKDKKLKGSNINIKGPEFNNKLDGKLEVPNAELNLQGSKLNGPNINIHEQKINGKVGGKIDIKAQEPLMSGIIPGIKTNSQKIDIKSPSANIKDSNNEFYLSGIIPSKDEQKNIQLGDTNHLLEITGKPPDININGDFSHKKKVNFHGSLNDQNYAFDKDLKGSRKIEFDGINDINVEMPRVSFNTNEQNNLGDSKPFESGGGNIGGGINISKNVPTKLSVKAENNLNTDNQIGININLDGDIKKTDIDLENLGKNFISEGNDTKVLLNSQLGGLKKKGKGLPMVGIKYNNFEQSKVDVGGQFDTNNVNIDNLRSANIGIGGQKQGERIIE